MSDAIDQDRVAVVVPLDGSDLAARVLPLARAFLGGTGELVLVQVLPGEGGALTELASADLLTPDQLSGEQQSEARGDLAPVVRRLQADGITTRALVLQGDPIHEITRVGAELDADLIVMATHGRGAVQRMAHGSVADGVSRQAATPVLLVRVRSSKDGRLADSPVRRLVVPHDGSKMADLAVPIAAKHAKRLGVPILLVRAVNPTAETSMAFAPAGGPDAMSATIYEEVLADEEKAATAGLDAVKATLAGQGIDVSSEVMVGTAVAVIAELHESGDIVVMSSHGRSGIGRWLLGSVAEKLVREGTAPVLIVPAADRVAAQQARA